MNEKQIKISRLSPLLKNQCVNINLKLLFTIINTLLIIVLILLSQNNSSQQTTFDQKIHDPLNYSLIRCRDVTEDDCTDFGFLSKENETDRIMV